MEGIREEVDAFVAMAQDYAEQMHGWIEDKEEQLKAVEAEVIQIKDVKDILTYVLSPAGTKKEGKTVYVNGIIDAAYVNDIIDEVTSSMSKGLGAYLSHPKALQAGLKAEHVVALRLYTTYVFIYMNRPLRDGKRKTDGVRPPMPVTTFFATEAIKKLRALNTKESMKDLTQGQGAGFATNPVAGGALEKTPSLDDTSTDTHPRNPLAPTAVMLSQPSQSRLRLPPLVGDSPLNPLEGSAPTVAFGVAPPPEEVNLSPMAQSDEQVEDCVEEFNEGEDLCAKTEGDKGLGRLESVKQILRAQSIKVLSKVAPYEPPKLGKGGLTLWRGMLDMKLEQKFHTNGGTEMAFMSTTSDMSVALKYSLSECSLFFKIVAKDFMVIGAELE